jgi:hypothetical protein
MKLYGYYLFHSFLGAVKKVFRTWVVIYLAFILVCALIGGVVGATLGASLDDDWSEEEDSSEIEEGEDWDEEDSEDLFDFSETELLGVNLSENLPQLAASVAFLLTLIWLTMEIVSGFGNSDTNIFTMPDVNFVFSSPVKPQSILTFRTLMLMGRTLFLTIWLGFCIASGLFLSHPALCGWILLTWLLLLLVSKCLSILCYLLTTANPQRKKIFQAALVLLFLWSALLFLPLVESENRFATFLLCMEKGLCRTVPIAGWLSGILFYGLSGKTAAACGYTFLTLAVICLLIFVIAKIRCDFYEDALFHATKRQAILDQAKEKKKQTLPRQKERKETVRRDLIQKGKGASVFFFKNVALTDRHAFLHILTPGSTIWLITALLLAAATRFLFDSNSVIPLAILFLFCLLIRNLGNPIAEELQENFIWMIPESTRLKLFYTFLGNQYRMILCFFPAWILSAFLVGGRPIEILLWSLLILSFDFFCSASGLFADLLTPTSLVESVRSMIQLLIITLSILPTVVLLAVGYFLSAPLPALGISAFLNLFLTALLLLFAPAILDTGRK